MTVRKGIGKRHSQDFVVGVRLELFGVSVRVLCDHRMDPRIARRLEDGPDRQILGFYGRPRAWSFGGDGLEDVEPSGAPGRPGGGAEAEQRLSLIHISE